MVVAPLPVRARAVGEPVALLTRERLPDTLPEAAGAKATLKLVLCPAARVRGKDRPLRENSVPESASLETVKLAVPELVSLTVCVLLVPRSTVPKPRVVEDNET